MGSEAVFKQEVPVLSQLLLQVKEHAPFAQTAEAPAGAMQVFPWMPQLEGVMSSIHRNRARYPLLNVRLEIIADAARFGRGHSRASRTCVGTLTRITIC